MVVILAKDGGYKPHGSLAFEPYPVMCKRLGLTDQRNKGPLSLIPEAESTAHEARMAEYRKALIAEIKATQVHTCEDWTFDPCEDSPYEWCPACRHSEWQRHSRAGQQLIVDRYLSEKYPQIAKPVAERKPILTLVTPFMKAMIEVGDATSLMLRDSLTSGMMRPWSYYCERDDSEWLTRKMPEREAQPTMSQDAYMAAMEQTHGPVKRKATVANSAQQSERQEPAFFARAQVAAAAAAVPIAQLSADTDARMARYTAWAAQERRKVRKPFFCGATIAGSCAPNDNKIVVKNLPLSEPSLQADMWEAVAAVVPVVDIYQPKAMFITLLRPSDVDAVLAAFPNGMDYNGTVVRFERASGRR
jgi:hypothetical protein